MGWKWGDGIVGIRKQRNVFRHASSNSGGPDSDPAPGEQIPRRVDQLVSHITIKT